MLCSMRCFSCGRVLRAVGPACRCAAGWGFRTNGRPDAGTAAAGCRYSRCPARRAAPKRSARRGGWSHLLRLLVEQLLRHLFPGEAQVTQHGDHPQAHRPAAQKQHRAGVAVIVVSPQFFGIGSCVR